MTGPDDSDRHEDDDLREVARSRMRNLPGETAGGRIDPSTVPPEQRRKARRDGTDEDQPED